MSQSYYMLILLVVFVVVGVVLSRRSRKANSGGDTDMVKRVKDLPGPLNPALVCPHCQEKGLVRTKRVKVKQGISGAKATGAILTGGLSVIGTGMSKKDWVTQAHCDNCGSTWHYS